MLRRRAIFCELLPGVFQDLGLISNGMGFGNHMKPGDDVLEYRQRLHSRQGWARSGQKIFDQLPHRSDGITERQTLRTSEKQSSLDITV